MWAWWVPFPPGLHAPRGAQVQRTIQFSQSLRQSHQAPQVPSSACGHCPGGPASSPRTASEWHKGRHLSSPPSPPLAWPDWAGEWAPLGAVLSSLSPGLSPLRGWAEGRRGAAIGLLGMTQSLAAFPTPRGTPQSLGEFLCNSGIHNQRRMNFLCSLGREEDKPVYFPSKPEQLLFLPPSPTPAASGP